MIHYWLGILVTVAFGGLLGTMVYKAAKALDGLRLRHALGWGLLVAGAVLIGSQINWMSVYR